MIVQAQASRSFRLRQHGLVTHTYDHSRRVGAFIHSTHVTLRILDAGVGEESHGRVFSTSLTDLGFPACKEFKNKTNVTFLLLPPPHVVKVYQGSAHTGFHTYMNSSLIAIPVSCSNRMIEPLVIDSKVHRRLIFFARYHLATDVRIFVYISSHIRIPFLGR